MERIQSCELHLNEIQLNVNVLVILNLTPKNVMIFKSEFVRHQSFFSRKISNAF